MPRAALEVLRQRLTPAAFVRAAMLAEVYTPTNAVEAGFLDQVVLPVELAAVTREVALRLASLDPEAFAATKLRAGADLLIGLRAAIDADAAELARRL
jgi:enoyl-CoA hydratase